MPTPVNVGQQQQQAPVVHLPQPPHSAVVEAVVQSHDIKTSPAVDAVLPGAAGVPLLPLRVTVCTVGRHAPAAAAAHAAQQQ